MDFLPPSEEYADKVLCFQLAQDNVKEALNYYENFTVSETFELLGILLANKYRPEYDNYSD